MKKSILIFATALVFGLTSCGSSDFTLVKEGMSKEEVVNAVGEPELSRSLMDETVLTYSSHIVRLKNNEVTEVVTKEEDAKRSENFQNEADDIEAELKKQEQELNDLLK